MNARNPREDLNQAFAQKPMPEGLEMSIRSRMSATSVPHRFINRKLTVSLATGICVVAIVFLMLPAQKAAASLSKIMSKVDGVKTAHLVFKNEDGAVIRETYYKDGRWKLTEGSKLVTIYSKGMEYRIKSDFDVVVRRKADGPFTKPIRSFRISDILGQHPNDGVRVETDVDDHGTTANRYTIVSGRERTTFYVNPKTELPYRSELELQCRNGWLKDGSIEMEFNRPIDDSTFSLSMSGTAKFLNYDELHPKWIKDMKDSNLGSIEIAQGKCVIHEVQVSERGDVFVVYSTDGIEKGQCIDPIGIRDNKGTKYVTLRDRLYQKEPLTSERDLRSAWFVAVNPPTVTEPRTIFVEAFINKVNAIVDRNATSYVVTKPIPKGVKVVTTDMMTPELDATPKVVAKVETRPVVGMVVPEYVHYSQFFVNLLDLHEKQRLEALGIYYVMHEDWSNAEREFRKALETMNQLDETGGLQFAETSIYRSLAMCLDKLGRSDEAKELIKEAQKWEPPLNSGETRPVEVERR